MSSALPVIPAVIPAAIPVYDAGREGALGLARQAPERLARIMALCRAQYGGPALKIGDYFARKWLRRNSGPLAAEVLEISEYTRAQGLGPGAAVMNLSYEFACTTATGPDPDGPGARMLRTLDWRLKGLGRELTVTKREGSAGSFYDLTWPGFAGAATGMAPGRFSAAVNQPPSRRHTPSAPLDWFINRRIMWRSAAEPPMHLLRRAFEICETYEDAKTMLTETPIAIPVFFTLAGARAEDGCVIERTETEARVHAAPFCIANHWIDMNVPGRGRSNDSPARRAMMEGLHAGQPNDFSWVRPPILNARTRVAVIANAQRGVLMVRGYEPDETVHGGGAPATADFSLT
ncbi:MAG: Ntn hydrolase family protein [Rhodospirillales bacterium]